MIYLSPKYLHLLAEAMDATRSKKKYEDFDEFLITIKPKLRDEFHDLYNMLIKEELRLMK